MTRRDRPEQQTQQAQATPQMKVVRRAVRNARRRQAGNALTGAYYWVPIPTKEGEVTWALLEFYDPDYDGSAGHGEVWPEVEEYLALKWGGAPEALRKILGGSPPNLPRGRVVETRGTYGITHEGDFPLSKIHALAEVKKAFNLGEVPTTEQEERDR